MGPGSKSISPGAVQTPRPVGRNERRVGHIQVDDGVGPDEVLHFFEDGRQPVATGVVAHNETRVLRRWREGSQLPHDGVHFVDDGVDLLFGDGLPEELIEKFVARDSCPDSVLAAPH